jgi:hypothetical protein
VTLVHFEHHSQACPEPMHTRWPRFATVLFNIGLIMEVPPRRHP